MATSAPTKIRFAVVTGMAMVMSDWLSWSS